MAYLFGIFSGLPSAFNNSFDSPAPYAPLKFFANWSDSTAVVKYPAAHYIITIPFYLLIIITLKIFGILKSISGEWPFGFTDPTLAFNAMIITSRLISTFMSIYVIYVISRINFFYDHKKDELRKFLFIVLLGFNGVYAFYSRLGNLDIPYIFWWVLSISYLWQYYVLSEKRIINLRYFSAFSALAVATKDQAAGLVLGSMLIIIYDIIKSRADLKNYLKHLVNVVLTFWSIYFIFAILPQPFRWLEHIKLWLPSNNKLTSWTDKYEPTIIGYKNLFSDIFFNDLTNNLSLGLIGFSFFGLFLLIKKNKLKEISILLVPNLTYILFIIVPIRFSFERYMLPLAISLTILASLGITHLFFLLNKKKFGQYLFLVFLISLIMHHMVYGFGLTTYIQTQGDQKSKLAKQIELYIPPNSIIKWEGGIRAFPNADVYSNHNFTFPESKKYSRSFKGVFRNENRGNEAYILSENKLDNFEDYELIRKWEDENFVEKYFFIKYKINYYLYRLRK